MPLDHVSLFSCSSCCCFYSRSINQGVITHSRSWAPWQSKAFLILVVTTCCFCRRCCWSNWIDSAAGCGFAILRFAQWKRKWVVEPLRRAIFNGAIPTLTNASRDSGIREIRHRESWSRSTPIPPFRKFLFSSFFAWCSTENLIVAARSQDSKIEGKKRRRTNSLWFFHSTEFSGQYLPQVTSKIKLLAPKREEILQSSIAQSLS